MAKAKKQLRQPAEIQYKDQLTALKQHDSGDKPANWLLSPQSVLSYILGGKTLNAKIGRSKKDITITPKFFGDRALVFTHKSYISPEKRYFSFYYRPSINLMKR